MARLDQLRKLAQAEPNDPMTHYAMGLEFINLDRWEDALTAFTRAIEVDPEYVAAFQQKGRTELHLQRKQEARQTLEKGITLARAAGEDKAVTEMGQLLELT